MEMNCTGIVFGNRGTYLQSLVGWGFISSSVMLYRLVCQTELYCSDITIKYLYSNLSFSIDIKTGCSDQNSNWCIVSTVGGTVSVTGER